MSPAPEEICNAAEKGNFFKELQGLYAAMDRAYDQAADRYGFSCTGCADSCCLTRFYHHTAIEYAYLLSGFRELPPERRRTFLSRAQACIRDLERAMREKKPFRHMCPVNDDGWCALYAHRPMICRLHGIPHELSPPGRPKIQGAGCTEFERQFGDLPYAAFDRTPFYAEMAGMERRFRAQAGISEKFRMTVAMMLISLETKGL